MTSIFDQYEQAFQRSKHPAQPALAADMVSLKIFLEIREQIICYCYGYLLILEYDGIYTHETQRRRTNIH